MITAWIRRRSVGTGGVPIKQVIRGNKHYYCSFLLNRPVIIALRCVFHTGNFYWAVDKILCRPPSVLLLVRLLFSGGGKSISSKTATRIYKVCLFACTTTMGSIACHILMMLVWKIVFCRNTARKSLLSRTYRKQNRQITTKLVCIEMGKKRTRFQSSRGTSNPLRHTYYCV